jgi:hypothetical protein
MFAAQESMAKYQKLSKFRFGIKINSKEDIKKYFRFQIKIVTYPKQDPTYTEAHTATCGIVNLKRGRGK